MKPIITSSSDCLFTYKARIEIHEQKPEHTMGDHHTPREHKYT